jgi:uncharacterized protein YjbI with pentapeptide repeats
MENSSQNVLRVIARDGKCKAKFAQAKFAQAKFAQAKFAQAKFAQASLRRGRPCSLVSPLFPGLGPFDGLEL